MRIYSSPAQAFREVERDLWEMGIDVHPQTMQNKLVADDPAYMTKELSPYAFQINNWRFNEPGEREAVEAVMSGPQTNIILDYIVLEFKDRVSGSPMNPGNSYKVRQALWNDFMVKGKFHYTYSERMAPQLRRILDELKVRPDTRQAIINIHSNIATSGDGNLDIDDPDSNFDLTDVNDVDASTDLENMGGSGRIPCSMYYQFLRRRGKLDLIYTMRSCDFLTHFAVDVMIALRIQAWFAAHLGLGEGRFTYFTGSLHAYHKDMQARGIF